VPIFSRLGGPRRNKMPKRRLLETPYYKFGRWLCPQQANALRYRIEGNKLRVDSGLFFSFRRSVPLERITDIVLFQNPMQRHFGVWVMQVRTAGFASNAVMYGVCEPENVREIIFAQRQSVYVGDVVCTPKALSLTCLQMRKIKSLNACV